MIVKNSSCLLLTFYGTSERPYYEIRFGSREGSVIFNKQVRNKNKRARLCVLFTRCRICIVCTSTYIWHATSYIWVVYRGGCIAKMGLAHRNTRFFFAFHRTRSAHRAHTWREIRPGACLPANLIYFGPDKKLIYRAREVRPGAVLGNDGFSCGRRRERENRKWRAGSLRRGPGHDKILSCDEIERKKIYPREGRKCSKRK